MSQMTNSSSSSKSEQCTWNPFTVSELREILKRELSASENDELCQKARRKTDLTAICASRLTKSQAAEWHRELRKRPAVDVTPTFKRQTRRSEAVRSTAELPRSNSRTSHHAPRSAVDHREPSTPALQASALARTELASVSRKSLPIPRDIFQNTSSSSSGPPSSNQASPVSRGGSTQPSNENVRSHNNAWPNRALQLDLNEHCLKAGLRLLRQSTVDQSGFRPMSEDKTSEVDVDSRQFTFSESSKSDIEPRKSTSNDFGAVHRKFKPSSDRISEASPSQSLDVSPLLRLNSDAPFASTFALGAADAASEDSVRSRDQAQSDYHRTSIHLASDESRKIAPSETTTGSAMFRSVRIPYRPRSKPHPTDSTDMKEGRLEPSPLSKMVAPHNSIEISNSINVTKPTLSAQVVPHLTLPRSAQKERGFDSFRPRAPVYRAKWRAWTLVCLGVALVVSAITIWYKLTAMEHAFEFSKDTTDDCPLLTRKRKGSLFTKDRCESIRSAVTRQAKGVANRMKEILQLEEEERLCGRRLDSWRDVYEVTEQALSDSVVEAEREELFMILQEQYLARDKSLQRLGLERKGFLLKSLTGPNGRQYCPRHDAKFLLKVMLPVSLLPITWVVYKRRMQHRELHRRIREMVVTHTKLGEDGYAQGPTSAALHAWLENKQRSFTFKQVAEMCDELAVFDPDVIYSRASRVFMQSFLQPKHALQRATELRSVGQTEEAFETLHRTIIDRKFRYMQWDASQQEDVVTQYAKLAIELDKTKPVREGLLQYRNHCQHTTAQLGPLIRVLTTFRSAAEARFAAAEAQKATAAAEDHSASTKAHLFENDFDTAGYDAAELLQITAVDKDYWADSQRNYSETMRLVVEVYRMIMDIVKTTPKLQKVYHETAHKAFEFCAAHQKISEFRRLCENVRSHYASILKLRAKPDADQATKADIEDLRRPEVHIETRLSQLKNAALLNLWKEAMQTIEDLYGLGIIDLAGKRVSTKTKSPAAVHLRQLLLMSLAAYYEKLAEVFGRSGHRALHALALLKWLSHTRQHNKAFTPEEYKLWASVATLAVIAVPVTRGPQSRSGPRFDEEKRLTTLLGYPTVPTRESLVAALHDRSVLAAALPCVREFFEAVEGEDFLPLTAVKRLDPLLKQIEEQLVGAEALITSKELEADTVHESNFKSRVLDSMNLLRRTVFRKLVISLSAVYSTISISYFRKEICPESFLPWTAAEHCLVALVEEWQLQLRLDYVNGVIRLSQVAVEDPHIVVFQRLGSLYSSLLQIFAASEAAQQERREAEMKTMRERLAQESKAGAQRLQLLEKRRKEMEQFQKRRDEDLEELARARAKKEAEAEREKQRALAEERQELKEREEAEQARLECVRLLIKKMTAVVKSVGCSPNHFSISGVLLANLTPEELLARQIGYRDFEQALEDFQAKTQQEHIKQKKLESKRIDHVARAKRLEEAAFVSRWAADIVKRDQELCQKMIEERTAERIATMEHLKAVRANFMEGNVLPGLQNYLRKLAEPSESERNESEEESESDEEGV